MGGILVTFFPNNGDDGNKEDEADTDGVGQNGRFDHCKGGCAEQNAFNNSYALQDLRSKLRNTRSLRHQR